MVTCCRVKDMKNASITRAVFVYMIFITLLSNILLGFVFGLHSYYTFIRETEGNRDKYIETEKFNIKEEVERIFEYIQYKKSQTESKLRKSIQEKVYMAHDIAKNIYDKAKESGNSETAILYTIKETLRPIRFNNGRGYFFILDPKGNEILYPTQPEYEDTNIINLQDDIGNYVIQDEIKIVMEKGEGFVKAHWMKPDSDNGMVYPKVSFVKMFEPLNIIIGTGEYLDDAEKDIQKEVLNWVKNIEYHNDRYNFILTYNGDFLIHNETDNLMGKNIFDLNDNKKAQVFIKMYEKVKSSKDNEGHYLEYEWNKPGEEKNNQKISYFKGFDDWKWLIGKGAYLDEIGDLYRHEKAMRMKDFREKIIIISIYLIILLGLSLIFAVRISRNVGNNLKAFTDFFKISYEKSTNIDIDKINYLEFKEMAKSANEMIDKRNHAEDKLKSSLMEKQALVKEIHHRVKNNLQIINSLLRLQSYNIDKNNIEKIFKETQNRIKSMALIQEKLYKKDNLKNINISTYLMELAYSLIVSYKVDLRDLSIKTDSDKDVMLGIDKSIPCGIIVNEIITNAIHHAFGENQPDKTIFIKLRKTNEEFYLNIKDNGIGMPEHINLDEPQTLGINLIKMLTNQIDGKVWYDTKKGKGTEFHLTFKL